MCLITIIIPYRFTFNFDFKWKDDGVFEEAVVCQSVFNSSFQKCAIQLIWAKLNEIKLNYRLIQRKEQSLTTALKKKKRNQWLTRIQCKRHSITKQSFKFIPPKSGFNSFNVKRNKNRNCYFWVVLVFHTHSNYRHHHLRVSVSFVKISASH